ncbi:MAG: signal peptidase I [Chloroflexota bacterium]|nr:signal peptidase I [Chloroflexota bacterium]
MARTKWPQRLRRVLIVIWGAALVTLVGVSALSHVASAAGLQLFIIRGGSMQPTLPFGSMISVAPVEPSDVKAGDVVTLRTESGVIVTHRVLDVDHAPDGSRMLQTKGDANSSADPLRLPDSAVIGEVRAYLPHLGYLMAFLSTATGTISALALVGTLMLAIWFLEELEAERRRSALVRVAEAVKA